MRKKSVEEFIAETNIESFRSRLINAPDEQVRALLTDLLRAEEAKLIALKKSSEVQ